MTIEESTELKKNDIVVCINNVGISSLTLYKQYNVRYLLNNNEIYLINDNDNIFSYHITLFMTLEKFKLKIRENKLNNIMK